MLVYMSSYPRSGSSLMQQIVNNFFGYPWTTVDTDVRSLDQITGIPEHFENWRYDPRTRAGEKSSLAELIDKLKRRLLKSAPLDPWLARYDLAVPPHTKDCQYLLPGCLHALTPDNRQTLANSNTYFFVKTHWVPYSSYFDHEYVVQMIRHPGPVMVSYLDHLKKYNQDETKSLDEVISGQVPYGPWSEWYKKWEQVLPELGANFLRVRFEDVAASNKQEICTQIKALIGLDYTQFEPEQSFEELQKQSPDYYRGSSANGWQKHYRADQIAHLVKLHGDTMSRLGYALPSTRASASKPEK